MMILSSRDATLFFSTGFLLVFCRFSGGTKTNRESRKTYEWILGTNRSYPGCFAPLGPVGGESIGTRYHGIEASACRRYRCVGAVCDGCSERFAEQRQGKKKDADSFQCYRAGATPHRRNGGGAIYRHSLPHFAHVHPRHGSRELLWNY